MLSYLVMHLAATSDAGLTKIFEALHFPLTTAKVPQFGELPITPARLIRRRWRGFSGELWTSISSTPSWKLSG